jgi:hypothetical protein
VRPVRPNITPAIDVTYAKDQPEYQALPAVLLTDSPQTVITEWVPSRNDMVNLINGGHLRISILTMGRPLQPLLVEVAQ